MAVTHPMVQSALVHDAARGNWADVVEEISRSCVRRAKDGQLLRAPGVVGVLAGSASVVWVHGPTDISALTNTLAASPEVDEVYVAGAQVSVEAALQQSGWACAEVFTQMVHDGADIRQTVSGGPAVYSLQPGDLADVRDLLRRHGGVEDAQLTSCYGDDFFTVAAPVWLFGARDAAGQLIGMVAVRRQERSAMGFALTVDPKWRSTGLSTALVAAAVRQACLTGAEFVHAQAGERSARRLDDCGFTAVGTWLRLVRA